MKFTLFTLDDPSSDSFQKVFELQGHTDWIRSIAVASYTDTHQPENYGYKTDDLMVATSSQDKYIRIWKISSTKGQGNESLDTQILDAMDL